MVKYVINFFFYKYLLMSIDIKKITDIYIMDTNINIITSKKNIYPTNNKSYFTCRVVSCL